MSGKDGERLHAHRAKGQPAGTPPRLRQPAVGLEAEFEVWVGGRRVRPERLFGDPRAFLPPGALHRTGSSYGLPTGGAVYFDTGVVEVATPVVEVARGCMARAGRSLWEGIGHVRTALDAWERRTGRRVRLVGFSTHYNVSFTPPASPSGARTVERLAFLLAHVLPVPVMLLAANRRSSGIGVRPRGDRLEVTADFTPSAALTIATGTFVAAVVREVLRWPSYEPAEAVRRGVPLVQGLRLERHPSRTGWRASSSSFLHDPFATSPGAPVWRVEGSDRRYSLRELARETATPFAAALRRLADPFTMALLRRLFAGEAPALLDLPDRPPAYEDVGRLVLWDDLFPKHVLRRSRYERILIRAVAGVPLFLHGRRYVPVGLRGWGEVVFRADDGSRHAFSLDALLEHLDAWERRRPS